MRNYAAAVAGALVATLGLAAWQTRTAAPAAATLPQYAWSAPASAMPVSSTLGSIPAMAAAGAASTLVRCAPGQRALVRQAPIDGQMTTTAECVWDTSAAGVSELRAMPVGDIVEYERPRAVPARYVVQEPAPRRVVTRRVKPQRSWKKTALVIGGSAGAGAGVGALAGGKKGALIGAAIGGGAASLFEAMKR